jgi:uncharacterized membrane protein YbjE (DUF340 family)
MLTIIAPINLFLIIGIIFGVIAGLMAYIITYEEWVYHYTTKKEPRKIALEAGVVAFIFFFLLSLIVGYVFTSLLSHFGL